MFSNWKEKFDLSDATLGIAIALSSHYSTYLTALANIYTENAILSFIIELSIVVIPTVLLMKIIEKYISPSQQLFYLWLIFIAIFPYFLPFLIGEDPTSSFLFGVWANIHLIIFGRFIGSIAKR